MKFIKQLKDRTEELSSSQNKLTIEFNNIRFEDLMGEFEKIYGVRIVINNADLKDNLCLGKFRRIDGLDYALQVLQVDIPFEFQHDFETKTFYIN